MIFSGFKKSKKASEFDILPIIIIMLIMGIGVLVGTKILSEVKYKLVDEGLSNSTTARNIITDANNDYSVVFDLVLPMIFLGLCIGMIIGAFLIKSYPALFMITIVMLILFILVVPVISNAYEKFCNKMTTECAGYTKTQYIFDYMPLILSMVGIITAIVLYAVFKE